MARRKRGQDACGRGGVGLAALQVLPSLGHGDSGQRFPGKLMPRTLRAAGPAEQAPGAAWNSLLTPLQGCFNTPSHLHWLAPKGRLRGLGNQFLTATHVGAQVLRQHLACLPSPRRWRAKGEATAPGNTARGQKTRFVTSLYLQARSNRCSQLGSCLRLPTRGMNCSRPASSGNPQTGGSLPMAGHRALASAPASAQALVPDEHGTALRFAIS